MTVLGYRGPDCEGHEEGAEHIHIGFVVQDARVAYDSLLAMDATFVRNGVKGRGSEFEAPAPNGSFKVADPEGNIVDVTGNTREWRY